MKNRKKIIEEYINKETETNEQYVAQLALTIPVKEFKAMKKQLDIMREKFYKCWGWEMTISQIYEAFNVAEKKLSGED